MTTLVNNQALILDIKPTDSTKHAHAVQVAWDVITPNSSSSSNAFDIVNPNYHVGGHALLVRPFRKVKPEALALCGIENGMLLEAPDFNTSIPRLMSINDCEYVICHDAKRTIQLLKNADVPAGDIEQLKFICITSLAKQHYKLSDYSTPTLYACASANTAARDLGGYYSGKFDPLFLRVIYEHLVLMLNLPDFECAYQKSLDASFDAVAYRDALEQARLARPEPDYCKAVHKLLSDFDGLAIECFISNASLHDAIATTKHKAVIVTSDGDEFIADDSSRYQYAVAYREGFELITLTDVERGISLPVLEDV